MKPLVSLQPESKTLDALSNFDIQEYYKSTPKFGGCPCNDEVKALVEKDRAAGHKKFYIINMSDRADGGSHWTLLFDTLYFDSFGCPPTLDVAPFATVWNDIAYQDFHSSACGFYCLFVADNLLAGLEPALGLIPDDDETPTHSSELVLQRHFKGTSAAGLFSSLRKRFVPRKAESARLRKFLDGKGDQAVAKIEIARKPVFSIVKHALNLASLGKFDKKRKELGYSDIFHQYLLVTLKDGSTYRVENNHQIEAAPATASDYKGQRSNVPITSEKSLKSMMATAAEGDPKFWTYDARHSNCQDFSKKMLERNGLDPAHGPEQQDSAALTDTLPTKGRLAKAITDTAQYLDQVVHGGAVNLGKWY